MNLDRNCQPVLRGTPDGIQVVVFLEGNDSSAWKLEYDEAAEEAQIDAWAINDVPPWAIALAVTDGSQVKEQLEAALSLVRTANEAYSSRSGQQIDIRAQAVHWWRMKIEGGPPFSS